MLAWEQINKLSNKPRGSCAPLCCPKIETLEVSFTTMREKSGWIKVDHNLALVQKELVRYDGKCVLFDARLWNCFGSSLFYLLIPHGSKTTIVCFCEVQKDVCLVGGNIPISRSTLCDVNCVFARNPHVIFQKEPPCYSCGEASLPFIEHTHGAWTPTKTPWILGKKRPPPLKPTHVPQCLTLAVYR